jgi:hypothetical protein
LYDPTQVTDHVGAGQEQQGKSCIHSATPAAIGILGGNEQIGTVLIPIDLTDFFQTEDHPNSLQGPQEVVVPAPGNLADMLSFALR